jgi:hypothetical protein
MPEAASRQDLGMATWRGLLGTLGFSIHEDGVVQDGVVSGTREVGHYVLKRLLPTTLSQRDRDGARRESMSIGRYSPSSRISLPRVRSSVSCSTGSRSRGVPCVSAKR